MTDFSKVMSKVGFHAVYEKGIKEAVDLAAKHGFSSVQIESTMIDRSSILPGEI